ncbi:tyrosine-type recombinase/integrase (plasmid) [Haloplanus ruber]|uniref:Tyrosine-type recombinase/integrase n=1 Tax=Haloplanus ruber TaxID=869892 RepID=A0ABD6CWU9_9EURY|nr:site-specific integrase [Haloplanus ruber]
MAQNENSQIQASVWLKPDQVEALRTAVYQTRPDYLQERDDAIIALMYDTGVRVGELVAIDVDHLREENTTLYLPGHIQKDYPTDNSPGAARIGLASDTTRTLTSYLARRWKETPALFPSRSSDRITTEGVRQMFRRVAETAGVEPFRHDGSRGDPSDVTPHALRHSVAYRMMNVEEGNTLYDVRSRLRHRSIQTTERVYDHLIEV